MTHSSLRHWLFALFTLSGFAGLIYESVWSHYLKLFLGHAAYAQTLVLCIFMGGMAAGAWLTGRLATRIARPLLVYALIEGLLGVAALLFDSSFRGAQAWMFDTVIPSLGSPLAIDLAKWSLAAAIILPQSILLGATFPLMSTGIVRLYPGDAGRVLGWLYFTNSLGAALGVLASGFLLVDAVGLPGTTLTAGLINFFLALAVYLLARTPAVWTAAKPAPPVAATGGTAALLLWIAALTGAASFLYEIAWIRMLSLVIGSATHSFELMLSSFITGLALGSFYIRGRIDAQQHPLHLLGWIQVMMGSLAIISIPLYMGLFDAMAFWLKAIDRNAQAYALFTLFAHGLCFVLMLPATFCAGMTLPLITASVLRQGAGEGGIGRVYAANTLGSIAGVLLAVHLVMPLMGLRSVVLTGALIDILLGVVLLVQFSQPEVRQRLALVCVTALVAVVIRRVPFDPQITSSGVFRHGDARADSPVVFHRDGKTATVDVGYDEKGGQMYIATNGKVDAGVNLKGEATTDDYTMVLLGVLPLSYHPAAKEIAVIGMGSGRSTHTLLHSPTVQKVHTIEIEPAMAEGAQQFGAATGKTFSDPRSEIHFEDAKTYFARSGQQYDLIISEPSNPWVSGVASLFSTEFYAQAKRYLAPGGLFVQWFHLYEIERDLAATVFNALDENFSDIAIYATNQSDLVIIATPTGKLPPLTDAALAGRHFAPLLDPLGIRHLDDLRIRLAGGSGSLTTFARALNPLANSDYFPVLDQGAVKGRFMGKNARDFVQLYSYSSRLERGTARLVQAPKPVDGLPHTQMARNAYDWAAYSRWRDGQGPKPTDEVDDSLRGLYRDLRSIETDCNPETLGHSWLEALQALTFYYAPYLDKTVAAAEAARLRAARCYADTDSTQRLWVDLFAAEGQDDWKGIQTATLALLKAGEPKSPHDAYLYTELLLADIKAEGYPAALNRALEHDARIPPSVPLAYLRANIGF